jgi:DNA mismatch repair protein MSH4
MMLKSFAQSVGPLFEALAGARSEMLVKIRENCRPEIINPTMKLIKEVINEDVTYQKTPLDLRNQRTYAVKVRESFLLTRRV